jgi:DHA1 family multidrug resistance protein-like MFS transporter
MRRELYLIVLVQILVALSMGIVGPIYSIYFEKISGSLKDVGIIIGTYWIIVGLLEIPFGMLSDKIEKRKIFAIGGILVSTSIFLYPIISNFYQILVAEIIGAIGYSMQMPAFYALLAEMTRKKRRGLEVGLIDSSWNVVYGIACMVSGLLVATFGFSLIFSLASFLHFSSSMIVGRKIKEVS